MGSSNYLLSIHKLAQELNLQAVPITTATALSPSLIEDLISFPKVPRAQILNLPTSYYIYVYNYFFLIHLFKAEAQNAKVIHFQNLLYMERPTMSLMMNSTMLACKFAKCNQGNRVLTNTIHFLQHLLEAE